MFVYTTISFTLCIISTYLPYYVHTYSFKWHIKFFQIHRVYKS